MNKNVGEVKSLCIPFPPHLSGSVTALSWWRSDVLFLWVSLFFDDLYSVVRSGCSVLFLIITWLDFLFTLFFLVTLEGIEPLTYPNPNPISHPPSPLGQTPDLPFLIHTLYIDFFKKKKTIIAY